MQQDIRQLLLDAIDTLDNIDALRCVYNNNIYNKLGKLEAKHFVKNIKENTAITLKFKNVDFLIYLSFNFKTNKVRLSVYIDYDDLKGYINEDALKVDIPNDIKRFVIDNVNFLL